jgi:hypothetical protein
MTPHYNSYVTYAANSLGKNLYVSSEVDGYTGQGNSSYCYGNITHQPRQYLTVGTAGGSQWGQPVTPPAQINSFENVTLLCDVCSAPVNLVVDNQIWCSSVGSIFDFGGPPATIRIAKSNYLYVSTAGTVCTYRLSCIPGTYASCGYQTVFVDTPCGTNYFVASYIVVRVGVNSSCFPVSKGRFSLTAVPCS